LVDQDSVRVLTESCCLGSALLNHVDFGELLVESEGACENVVHFEFVGVHVEEKDYVVAHGVELVGLAPFDAALHLHGVASHQHLLLTLSEQHVLGRRGHELFGDFALDSESSGRRESLQVDEVHHSVVVQTLYGQPALVNDLLDLMLSLVCACEHHDSCVEVEDLLGTQSLVVPDIEASDKKLAAELDSLAHVAHRRRVAEEIFDNLLQIVFLGLNLLQLQGLLLIHGCADFLALLQN